MHPTERFTRRADDYVAARPSYPEESLATLFADMGEPAELSVVDLGAGTGISSRQLAACGASVLAVEPNEAMRNAAEPAERVAWHAGTAERTGLPNACAHVVTAFQAFHWFDHPAALREMLRILRPGGRAAVIYNERDESDPFTAAYGALVRRHATDETERRRAAGRAAFEAFAGWRSVRVVESRNAQRLDRAGLHARARSTSYLPQEGPPADEVHAALDRLFDEHARDDAVTLRLKTIVSLATARA